MASYRALRNHSGVARNVVALVAALLPAVPMAKPLVAVTSPADQSLVSGETWVTVAYRSDTRRPIVRVELHIDGQMQQEYVLPAPALDGQKSFAIDASRLPPGAHKITARVLDSAGEVGSSQITVTVPGTPNPDNDRIPPVVGVYYPAQGATVSGRVTIRAEATDNVGVRHVIFYVDGKLHTLRMNAPPFTADWDTTDYSNGPHIIEARAKDAADNEGQSAPVTVIVQNPGRSPAGPASSVGGSRASTGSPRPPVPPATSLGATEPGPRVVGPPTVPPVLPAGPGMAPLPDELPTVVLPPGVSVPPGGIAGPGLGYPSSSETASPLPSWGVGGTPPPAVTAMTELPGPHRGGPQDTGGPRTAAPPTELTSSTVPQPETAAAPLPPIVVVTLPDRLDETAITAPVSPVRGAVATPVGKLPEPILAPDQGSPIATPALGSHEEPALPPGEPTVSVITQPRTVTPEPRTLPEPSGAPTETPTVAMPPGAPTAETIGAETTPAEPTADQQPPPAARVDDPAVAAPYPSPPSDNGVVTPRSSAPTTATRPDSTRGPRGRLRRSERTESSPSVESTVTEPSTKPVPAPAAPPRPTQEEAPPTPPVEEAPAEPPSTPPSSPDIPSPPVPEHAPPTPSVEAAPASAVPPVVEVPPTEPSALPQSPPVLESPVTPPVEALADPVLAPILGDPVAAALPALPTSSDWMAPQPGGAVTSTRSDTGTAADHVPETGTDTGSAPPAPAARRAAGDGVGETASAPGTARAAAGGGRLRRGARSDERALPATDGEQVPSASLRVLSPADAPAISRARVALNGRALPDEARPVLRDGVFMISLKHAFEAVDGALYWFDTEKRGRAVSADADVTVQVGSRRAVINGQSRELGAAPVLQEGRLLVPLDLVEMALGMKFGFDPTARTVVIRR